MVSVKGNSCNDESENGERMNSVVNKRIGRNPIVIRFTAVLVIIAAFKHSPVSVLTNARISNRYVRRYHVLVL